MKSKILSVLFLLLPGYFALLLAQNQVMEAEDVEVKLMHLQVSSLSWVQVANNNAMFQRDISVEPMVAPDYSIWDEFTQDPLDTGLLQCMEVENPGTYGETICLRMYENKWEEELDRINQMLESSTDVNTRKKWQKSQKQWNKFKAAEFAFIEENYKEDDGTMYARMAAFERLMLVRHRALELTVYETRRERE